MSLTKKNITANFIGKIVAIVTSVVFVPVYIRYLGIEAYGVIGFFITVQTILSLLDFGMGATVNRQMASLSARSGINKELLDTQRTFEYVYWISAGIALLLVIFSSGFVAHHWLNKSQLQYTDVRNAVMVMGVNFFFQFPWNVYNSSLLGLQRQVVPNVISVVISLLKAIGSILILQYISTTLFAFLLFQAICTLLQTLAAAIYLKRILRIKHVKPQFSKEVLQKNWKYSAGLFLTSVLAVLLTQVDKLLLSTLVPLQVFGYYVLAGAVSTNLETLIMPIQTAYFPQFSQLNAIGDHESLKYKFHQSSRLIALLVVPIGVTLFFLSKQVLYVWTGDESLAENAYILLSILVCGMMFNTLMTMPYAMTLATGWVRFGSKICMVALLFLIPFVFFSTKAYGAKGGAMAWALLNIGFLIFAMRYFFSRLMVTEKLKWYWNIVFLPLLISAPIGTGFFFLYAHLPFQLNRWGQLAFLGVVYFVISLSLVLIAYQNILGQFGFFSFKKRIKSEIDKTSQSAV